MNECDIIKVVWVCKQFCIKSATYFILKIRKVILFNGIFDIKSSLNSKIIQLIANGLIN